MKTKFVFTSNYFVKTYLISFSAAYIEEDIDENKSIINSLRYIKKVLFMFPVDRNDSSKLILDFLS